MIRATPTSESLGIYSSLTSVLINFALMRFRTKVQVTKKKKGNEDKQIIVKAHSIRNSLLSIV